MNKISRFHYILLKKSIARFS